MVKKKPIEKGLESFTFKIFLKSLTLPKIKELINRHNDSILEENTQDEIHLAVNEKKPFLTIYLKDTELNAGLKMRIRRMQGIMKYEMDENRFFEKLTQDLNELIS